MKAQLFILFLVIFIFSEPILADLAVDQGPSWSWGKLNQNRYAIYGDFDNNESVQWLILGDDSYKEGNYNEALERYEHALILTNRANNNEILPSVIENHIGDTFFKLGQYKNALQNYDEVQASIGDNDNENLKDQGAALIALGRYDEALSIFNKVIADDTQDSVALHGKGLALYRLGKYQEALASYNVSSQINSTDALIWKDKGDVTFDLGSYQEALNCYEKAIQTSSNPYAILAMLSCLSR